MKQFITITAIGIFTFGNLFGKTHLPSIVPDSTVEVKLYTSGTVSFAGAGTATSSGKPVVTKAKANADTLIKNVQDSKSKDIKIVTKKEDAGKSHGSTLIDVPKSYNLKFETATGSVSLTDVDGKVKGSVKEGAITILRGKGKLEANTQLGDITVTASEASGFVMTKSGNVTLQDVKGNLTGISQNGKVSYKTTSSYFTGRKADKFQINYDEADIDIASAPEGAEAVVIKGNISIQNALKNIVLQTDEGNLTVLPASMGVRAITRKGKAAVQLAQNFNSTEPIIIETKDGDVDLRVPRNFTGSFVITLIQTKNLTTPNKITSFIDLGSVVPQDIIDPKSKLVVNKQTQVNKAIGTSKRQVKIRVVNGNVNILPVN